VSNITPFADERHLAFCAQCGGGPETRDHIPPKTFLDKPFPANPPVVGTCERCNRGASLDEEYVACLIEVASCGSADPAQLERPRIGRALARNPALAARFQAAYDPLTGAVHIEAHRVRRVVEKMARGLWAYELAEPALGMAAEVAFQPLHNLDDDGRAEFEYTRPAQIFAEVGSRMMIRQATALGTGSDRGSAGWQLVQPNRFRYAVQFGERTTVKLVVREYLAVEVQFAERE
jgi:hypothetical protein